MINNTIKETCCCGASLEYTESVQEQYESNMGYRQASFREAHQDCPLNKDTTN